MAIVFVGQRHGVRRRVAINHPISKRDLNSSAMSPRWRGAAEQDRNGREREQNDSTHSGA